MSLNDIVTVNITRQTVGVDRASFGFALLFGCHTKFTERVKWYDASGWAAAMQADGFSSDDLLYSAASDYFSQEPSPTRVAIGRVKADSQHIDIDVVASLVDYEVLIKSASSSYTAHKYTSDSSATKTEIVDGLVALINAGAEASKVTASNDGDRLKLVPDGADAFAVKLGAGSTRMSIAAATGTEDPDDALDAVMLADKDWYGICMVHRTQANVQKVMDWTEANERLFITASDDPNVADQTVGDDTTSIAYYCKANAFARSAVIYDPLADTQFPDAAWLGKCLAYDPGSINWAFKTLAGITVPTITPTQQTNVWNKYANTYQAIAGINITQKATTGANEFIDVTHGCDWLKARLQEDLFQLLASSLKVPYTDKGAASILGVVKAVLKLAEDNGFLAPFNADDGDYCTVPKVSEVSSTDRANRLFPDVNFSRRLAGAINEITVNGIVTV